MRASDGRIAASPNDFDLDCRVRTPPLWAFRNFDVVFTHGDDQVNLVQGLAEPRASAIAAELVRVLDQELQNASLAR